MFIIVYISLTCFRYFLYKFYCGRKCLAWWGHIFFLFLLLTTHMCFLGKTQKILRLPEKYESSTPDSPRPIPQWAKKGAKKAKSAPFSRHRDLWCLHTDRKSNSTAFSGFKVWKAAKIKFSNLDQIIPSFFTLRQSSMDWCGASGALAWSPKNG